MTGEMFFGDYYNFFIRNKGVITISKNNNLELDSNCYFSIYIELSEILGVESKELHDIFQRYKGSQITFPVHLYNKEYICRYIEANYTGRNMGEISRLFGYSEKRMRQIWRDYKNSDVRDKK